MEGVEHSIRTKKYVERRERESWNGIEQEGITAADEEKNRREKRNMWKEWTDPTESDDWGWHRCSVDDEGA